MNKTLATTALTCALLVSGTARAQSVPSNLGPGSSSPRTLYFLNWEVTKPIGGFSDYIDATSYRGFSFEGRNFLRNNISVGLSFSWNRFNQTKDLVSVPITNGTASGPVYRDASMFAIRGLVHFYLLPGALRPYVGAGIGGSWDYAFQQVADLSRSQSNFDFIVDPEVGLLLSTQRGYGTIALNVAARYTYTTATVGSVHNTPAWGLILGLAFGY